MGNLDGTGDRRCEVWTYRRTQSCMRRRSLLGRPAEDVRCQKCAWEREREKGGEIKIITIPEIKTTTTKPGYSTTKGCPRCIFAIVFERSGVSANKARIRPTSSSTVKSINVPSSKRYETSAIDASCEIEYIVKIKRTRYKAGSY